jgi:gamma-glutamyl-gamma-aminobutyrate hydrolase PuuD
MKYLFTSLLLSATISAPVAAAVTINQTTNIDCKLPKSKTLIIGCTTTCGRFNSWGVKSAAKKLGYKVKLVNLRSKNQTIDYTQVDGIVIPGGSDIDPKWYKNNVTPEMKQHIESIEHLTKFTKIGAKRDKFEFDLLSKYFRNENQRYQPVLGICRGMQVLTASQGIPLYVDIKTELGIKNRKWKLDKIRVTHEESLIKEVIGRSNFRGVELHHQGLNVEYFNTHKAKWPYLNVTSLSNGGHIAESLEFYNRPVLGVQFHPEYTFGKVRNGVYKWLLKRSCFNHQFGKNKEKGL